MWIGALVLTVLLRSGGADPWWSNAVYYSVLVDSFKDTDGDGLGDLKGEEFNSYSIFLFYF